jgi:dolichol-phosphate mannosyltransferase
MKVRISQLLHSRLLKFVIVGGSGAMIQFISLHFYRQAISSFQLAFFLAIETAVLSNFIWNNSWTFKDRKLKPVQIPGKFLQFNLASGGSILIQQTIAFLGERFIGLYTLFGIPMTPFTIDTGAMFAVTGILVGMFWNFFAYSHIVWKKK